MLRNSGDGGSDMPGKKSRASKDGGKSQKTGKMICNKCNQEMNQHAEKLVDPTSPEEAARIDPALGGIVEEVHACPQCGHSGSGRAS